MAKLLLVAACALIDRDGRVLLAKRPEGKAFAGLWEFPGGKLNEGETPEEALVRELDEELGVNTQASCLAPIAFASRASDDFHLLMPLFACRKWRGAPIAKEADALVWAKPNEFRRYEMPPADIPLAAQLRDLI
ncbi:MAG: (deoxy)nucleoside triphosphate pyrophosphohydrolase [Pseudomonadota bacterium]